MFFQLYLNFSVFGNLRHLEKVCYARRYSVECVGCNLIEKVRICECHAMCFVTGLFQWIFNVIYWILSLFVVL